jgi:hypothetical protein
MDKGDLAADQTTNKDLVAVADCPRHREDLVTFRMRPPVATNRLSGDGLDKRWDWPMRGFEHDTVPTNESKRLARCHRYRLFGRPNGCVSAAAAHSLASRRRLQRWHG